MTPTSTPYPRIPLPREALRAFCRKWDVREFALFGSVLRDDFDAERSDVDVLVRFGPRGPQSWDLWDAEDELARIFGRKVDLLKRESVEAMRNPWRKSHILQHLLIVDGLGDGA